MYVNCPHCNGLVEVVSLHCCIFRHGVFKHTDVQIDPHLCEQECKRIVEEDLIFGCGKPFRVVNGVAEICPYI
jgi:hypothetical protein